MMTPAHPTMSKRPASDTSTRHLSPVRCIAVCLAALLLLSSLAGCRTTSPGDTGETGAGTDEKENAPMTGLPIGQPTDEETRPADPPPIPPEDTPKKGPFITSTDLSLPDYRYTETDPAPFGIHPASRDLFRDTWTATDDLGRSTPDSSETRAPTDRLVGMFYFLWRDADQDHLSDIAATDHFQAYLEGGTDGLWEAMKIGGEGHPHYWAEPYFGYYSSNDEWVLRKHAYMLADAGVDFVFFDTSNNNLHTRSHMTLFRVWEAMRREGVQVPEIAFLCGSVSPSELNQLYSTVYEANLYRDLWFMWEGKPLLLLTGHVPMSEEMRNFFTIRYSWAVGNTNWYAERKGKDCWPWSCTYPQKIGFGSDGKTPEQMVVMCGEGAMTGRSRNHTIHARQPKGTPWEFGFSILDTFTPQGLMYKEHFDYATEKDPPVIMITGFNEWIAGRWSGAGAGRGGVGLRIANEYVVSADPHVKESNYFVDAFNPEFSRDIEPMKGGFGDNYLCQTAQNTRRYKGSRAVETAFGQWAIDLDGSVGQWYAVGPEYRDAEGDVADRCSPGHVGGKEHGMYVNFSGRNDFVTAKVSHDSHYLYFYIECADDITPPEGTNWMNLFINADGDAKTGFHGYDYLLNRARDDQRILIERFTGTDEWAFETVGTAEYRRTGRIMQIKLEQDQIGFTGTLEFKWADNSLPTHNIMEFLDQGDTAPDERYNYVYTLKDIPQKIPDGIDKDLIVLKSRSYNGFVNGKPIRLVDGNTNGVLLASGYELYLPVAFLESVLGISCDGVTPVSHYGIPYIRADERIRASGKVLTITQDGLVVIADHAVTDENLLRLLYRSLS